MNCINCGQPLPEEKELEYDVPTGEGGYDTVANIAKLEFRINIESLQLGLSCPTCQSNAVAIKDLMKRGALDGQEYMTMQLERKIVKHLYSNRICGCDLDGFCNEMRKLLGWKLK